jgi:hypothetical protein
MLEEVLPSARFLNTFKTLIEKRTLLQQMLLTPEIPIRVNS